MIYTKEDKKKIFDSLPEDLKEAILSVETSEKLKKISENNSLMLDQVSELGDEVGLFMIGLTKQADFVKNISRRLNVKNTAAEKISREINVEIFDSIRFSLQKIQNQSIPASESMSVIPPPNLPTPNPSSPLPNFSGLEKAGQFTIEKTAPASTSSQYSNVNINKDALLKSIEDKPEPAAIPMIDHLLTAHVNPPENIEVKKVEVVEKKPEEEKLVEKKPVEAKKPYAADPYREQL